MKYYFLAGLWDLIWHFSAGTLIIAGGLAWAWFMPVGKKTALCIAAAVAIAMGGLAQGVKMENTRWKIKWNLANQAAVTAGQQALHDADDDITGGFHDPADVDRFMGGKK